MLDFISTVCLVYICYKISDPADFKKFKKKEYKDPWRRQCLKDEAPEIEIGDLVRWRFWMSDVFEGPQPIGIVINILHCFTPKVCEVLYTSGRIQHESMEALEIVLPKDD